VFKNDYRAREWRIILPRAFRKIREKWRTDVQKTNGTSDTAWFRTENSRIFEVYPFKFETPKRRQRSTIHQVDVEILWQNLAPFSSTGLFDGTSDTRSRTVLYFDLSNSENRNVSPKQRPGNHLTVFALENRRGTLAAWLSHSGNRSPSYGQTFYGHSLGRRRLI